MDPFDELVRLCFDEAGDVATILSLSRPRASASSPVTASMRRMPAAMLLSLAMRKNPILPDGRCVGASAELFGVVDIDDAHFGAIFFSEELLDLLPFLRLFIRELIGVDRKVFADLCIDEIFDCRDLFRRQGFVVAEVKAEARRIDNGSRLLDVFSQDLVERPMEQVGGCVVVGDFLAACSVDGGCDFVADLECAFFQFADVGDDAFVGRLCSR